VEDESRTVAHRRAKALEAVGRRLIEFPISRLEAAPLSAELREAILAGKKMSREALRRQGLYIGGLLRSLGDEAQAIVDFVENGEQQSPEQVRRIALLEDWRARLIREGEEAITALLELHRDADRQRIRKLLRTAGKETEQGKPPAAARKLFVYLRELFSVDDSPETD